MRSLKSGETVVIGKVAAGTRITRPIINMMMADFAAGLPPATYIDGRVGLEKHVTTVAEEAVLEITIEQVDERAKSPQ